MGLSRVFDISRRSLATYQKAMDITSHNVANASNENYTRQRISFSAENPEKTANFVWGAGVKIDDVARIRSKLVDSQIRTNNGEFQMQDQKSAILSQIEQVFSEPSELGISNSLTKFFNSWNELTVTPNSTALRYQVVQSSQQLSSRVKTVYDNINTIKYDTMRDFSEKTTRVNDLLKQIQKLNVQIVDSGAVGISANDVMDSRDAIIDELSTLVNVSVITDNKNAANVSIGGIQALDASGYVEFDVQVINGKLSLVTKDNQAKVALTGGQLAGLSSVYSEKIPDYIKSLDDLSNKLVETVNEQHLKGYSLTDPPQNGIMFFESYNDGNLIVNNNIVNDINQIAVSADGTEGNSEIAVKIANINHQKTIDGTTMTDFYSRMLARLGNDKQTSDRFAETTDLVIQQLTQQKGSVSGVSIDEEMTNIIKYQRSYQASARLISIADEMLETVIRMV